MKTLIAPIALLCLLASQTVTAQSDSKQADIKQEVNLNQSLFLTIAQREALSVEAMQGSGAAASKLFMFYGFVALNPTEEHRWVAIGAENGDPVAAYNLYQDLIDSEDHLDKERAIFWLKKAARGGDKMAQDELGRLEGQNTLPGKKGGKKNVDSPEK